VAFWPLARGPLALALAMLFAAEFVLGFGLMMLDISFGAIHAAVVPAALRSRVSGAFAAVNYGTRPFGALLGGLLGASFGLRPALWVAVLGGIGGALLLLPTPVPGFRLPELQGFAHDGAGLGLGCADVDVGIGIGEAGLQVQLAGAHVAVGVAVRGRVGLEDLGARVGGVPAGGIQKSFAQALVTRFGRDEEAGYGPHLVTGQVRDHARGADRGVAMAGGDGAPADWLGWLGVGEDADRVAGPDLLGQRGGPALLAAVAKGGRAQPPAHARAPPEGPVGARETFEVTGGGRGDRREPGHAR
jgi:hypothetical protein